MGKSAGGFTALAALAFRDTFKAGASWYGVSINYFNKSTKVFLVFPKIVGIN